jgi:hypothetical protein
VPSRTTRPPHRTAAGAPRALQGTSVRRSRGSGSRGAATSRGGSARASRCDRRTRGLRPFGQLTPGAGDS